MAKSLVIVESPTKARTIARFLGPEYVVESSMGHVRDLPESAKDIPAELKKEPWARLGIDIEHGFKPFYVISSDKKKQLAKLRGLLKGAAALYLATDEDREGESISWHLREVLRPKVLTRRLVFHEITKEAIQQALRSPRDIDARLVTAQETRRVLDRLYGYEISPLLWRKIAPALSAGRVQSVAVRMVVMRERERMAFRAAHYWDLGGSFAKEEQPPFAARLVALDGGRLVSGKDFDDRTGQLMGARAGLVHLDQAAAEALRERLGAAQWRVTRIERKPYTSQPAAPFTTSTMQQEASRKLGFTAQRAMRAAQALYERGYITYMRTDSTTLSEQALTAARREIRSRYGEASLPESPRVYRTRVKNAQEAHEAIRPAGDRFRLPDSLRGELEGDELRLYDLIWKRTIASQMADARGERMTLELEGRVSRLEGGSGGATVAGFQATGRTITFPGYLRAYVEGSDDPLGELSEQDIVLPPLAEGDALECRELELLEHVTQPPPRFTEASLIKELEKEGIGRPSTYAAIISTILQREYAVKRGGALVPTFTAFAVVQLLEQFFRDLVDTQFTARMEDALDAISNGEQESLPYLREFYFGNQRFPGLSRLLEAEIDPREACTIPLAEDSRQRRITIRVGKYGPYLERDGERVAIPADQVPDELTPERAEMLLEQGSTPEALGLHPGTGEAIYVKSGRYGPYVQMGEAVPKMKSLLPGQRPETLTLEEALKLLALPRIVGVDPATGEPIKVDLGRYGPYARRGRETRSLPSSEALFTFTLEEAQALFAREKSFRRGQPTPIRELGPHPRSQAPVRLMSGRFGPYVTDGTVNASLPRGTSATALTLDEALSLLAKRMARAPAPKPAARTTARRTGHAGARGGARGGSRAGGSTDPKPAASEPARRTAKPGRDTARKPALRKKRAAGG
jgi:DNA topoisomerase-1